MTFNQFLVRDEQPFLFHTGMRALFGLVAGAIARLIAPADLRWVAFALHRLAGYEPTTLALMHGSSFTGDGGAELRSLAAAYAPADPAGLG
jgi:hypothetical protein